jgi:hypothetical protein
VPAVAVVRLPDGVLHDPADLGAVPGTEAVAERPVGEGVDVLFDQVDGLSLSLAEVGEDEGEDVIFPSETSFPAGGGLFGLTFFDAGAVASSASETGCFDLSRRLTNSKTSPAGM